MSPPPPVPSFKKLKGRASGLVADACAARVLTALVAGVLFDIDGTMTDSDPIHFIAFKQHLKTWGYKVRSAAAEPSLMSQLTGAELQGHNNGEEIDREFFDKHLSGGQNSLLGKFLWPDRSPEDQAKFGVEKEDLFRSLAREQLLPWSACCESLSSPASQPVRCMRYACDCALHTHVPHTCCAAEGKLKPVTGLPEFIEWLKANNIRRVAVSNAPKPNVEAMLKALGLETFFEDIMLGELFEKPKPFPDPYLAGLKVLGMQKDEVCIFEDSPAGGALCLCSVQGLQTSSCGQQTRLRLLLTV